MAPSQRNRQKIEPLNYAEMATAPALKGMTSFLEISPEEFRAAQSRMKREKELTPGDETSLFSGKKPSQPIDSGKHLKQTYPGDETTSGATSRPKRASAPQPSTTGASVDLTPGRGRSKVRRCILAQDGHSLGEETVYQVLWRSGRPETTDPNGARTVRIGAAELGNRINMAKKNVRMNISRLFEKLSIEILENFETMSSQARLYRVFSFKQILERRRAAGLEFVLRNKGVVFCTAEGNAIVSSPAFLSTPGDETVKPSAPRLPRAVRQTLRDAAFEKYESAAASSDLGPSEPYVGDPEDVAIVSKALNRYWAADEAASVRLLQDCRRRRPDATATEVAFFVSEKVELARQNPKIVNPTGLVLVTVPQCFSGETFDAFRRKRHERHDRERGQVKELEVVRSPEAIRTLVEVAINPSSSEAEKREALSQLAGRQKES